MYKVIDVPDLLSSIICTSARTSRLRVDFLRAIDAFYHLYLEHVELAVEQSGLSCSTSATDSDRQL